LKIKKIIKREAKDEPINSDDESIVFSIIQKDTVGRSGSNLWGEVTQDGITRRGLYKEYNYDMPNSAYCEKLWSIVGKIILDGVRIPDIDIVKEPGLGDGLISYIVLDNDLEDMTHMTDILFNNFQREEQKARQDIFSIKDLLDSIRVQVLDDENYKKIEKSVIEVILLDAITNNPDRHPNNWALVRNKTTNYYDLALFDNAVSFVNMVEHDYMRDSEWFQTYIKADTVPPRCIVGDNGNEIIKYVSSAFPEYFEEFVTKFADRLPEVIQAIEKENLPIENRRLIYKLSCRKNYIEKLLGRGEMYDD